MTLPAIAHRTPVPPEQWAEVQRPAIEVGLLLALIYPDRVTWCARCHRLPASDMCWYCDADLCCPCWEDEAHCGHPEAFAINEASRNTDGEGRRRIAEGIMGLRPGEHESLLPDSAEPPAEGWS